MTYKRLLAHADPEVAARAAVRMARATVNRPSVSFAGRARARSILDLGVDELASRIRQARDAEHAEDHVLAVRGLLQGDDVPPGLETPSVVVRTSSAPGVPAGDHVFVQVHASGRPVDSRDEQGRQSSPPTATVLAVGPGRWDKETAKQVPPNISAGDEVIYSKYGGTHIKYGGEEILILSARDVLAVVNKTGDMRSTYTSQRDSD